MAETAGLIHKSRAIEQSHKWHQKTIGYEEKAFV